MIMSKHKELLVGLIATVSGFLLAYESAGMDYPSKTFPLMVSSLITLFGVILTGMALWRRASSTTRFWPGLHTLAVIACAVVYTVIIEPVGFYLSSFLCILVLSILTATSKVTLRSLGLTVISSLVFLGAIWLLFSYVLQSTIPTGNLF